jgi:Putative MetA-pathway of phenol degradation
MATRLSVLTASTFSYVQRRAAAPTLLVALSVGCGTIFAAAAQTGGSSQSPSGQRQSGADTAAPDYNGLDYTRPQQNADLRFQFRPSSSPTSQTETNQLFLRLTTKIDLPVDWKLGLLGQVAFVDKETTTTAPPSTAGDAGFGDSVFQAALIHSFDAHWAYGFGARLVSPTAEDSLGSGKWQIMPGFGVRYSFLEINRDTYFVPVLRWAVSFAGDPSRRNINEPQIAPTLNIALPERWFITFYPSNDIRINYGDPVAGQTGRLFLPFDAAIGRNITDRITAYLEMSAPIVNDYPVYKFKAELRISVKF